jgi:hypothetical protein
LLSHNSCELVGYHVAIEIGALRTTRVNLEFLVVLAKGIYELSHFFDDICGFAQIQFRDGHGLVQAYKLFLDFLIGCVPQNVDENIVKTFNSLHGFPSVIGFIANQFIVDTRKIDNPVQSLGRLHILVNFSYSLFIGGSIKLPTPNRELVKDICWNPADVMLALVVNGGIVLKKKG